MPSSHEVADRVRSRLLGINVSGISLRVLVEGVRQEDDCWYVPVQPTVEPDRTNEYYHLLADVEGSLLNEEGLNILLIPTAPEPQKEPES